MAAFFHRVGRDDKKFDSNVEDDDFYDGDDDNNNN
jgi:hypothetical protein